MSHQPNGVERFLADLRAPALPSVGVLTDVCSCVLQHWSVTPDGFGDAPYVGVHEEYDGAPDASRCLENQTFIGPTRGAVITQILDAEIERAEGVTCESCRGLTCHQCAKDGGICGHCGASLELSRAISQADANA